MKTTPLTDEEKQIVLQALNAIDAVLPRESRLAFAALLNMLVEIACEFEELNSGDGRQAILSACKQLMGAHDKFETAMQVHAINTAEAGALN